MAFALVSTFCPAAQAPTPPLRETFTDAERAEQYLAHMRALYIPHGEEFRKMVLGIHNSTHPECKEEATVLRVFDARPKYVLRKLAFSMLPTNNKCVPLAPGSAPCA